MKLLMISGDRSVLQGKKGAFWQTLQGFARHWDRIDVICPRTAASDELRAAGRDGIKVSEDFPNVYFHPSPWILIHQPWWILKKGTELIQAFGHETMTVHEYPPFYNGFGAHLLHKRMGIPYCLEIHHIVGEPVPSSLSERIGRFLTRQCIALDARQAKAVRVVNQSVGLRLRELGVPGDKISIVPSFYLDPAVLRADESIIKEFDLVFCGRLVENKGLIELLGLVYTMPGVSLLVLGDGPLRTQAERVIESLGMGSRVTLRGWLPDQASLIRAIQSAKVFVMNSRSEGGPRVALEAMACGMPVVSTPVGVMPEVIVQGENGFLASGTSEMGEIIGKLLADVVRRRTVGQAAQEILKRFDRTALLSGYASFLQRLAD